ncbi:MAG: hypothetical protein ACI85F_000159 [Bacteroidia bacterium]|jgi:hypothetical protein
MENGLNIPTLDLPRIVIIGSGFAGLRKPLPTHHWNTFSV